MTTERPDSLRVLLKVVVYAVFSFLGLLLLGRVLVWLGGFLLGITLSLLIAAIASNALMMRIYERLRLADIGLRWNAAGARNLGIGLLGGIGAACLVLSGPMLFRAAYLAPVLQSDANWRTFLFVPLMLLCGAAGEEMLFRGYAFQVLLRAWGPYATILPVSILFAALHANNPNATWLGLGNTAGFGVLFGYAFLRSADLWLPIGLHFGWNFTLPLFGVNISGITMRVTGYALEWRAGPLWSGGAYGPEASILTSIVLFALALYVWKAPVSRNVAPLLAGPVEN